MKKYLISGFGPGTDGVGQLMNILQPLAESKNYTVKYIFFRKRLYLDRIKKKRYLDAFSYLIESVYKQVLFGCKLFFIKNSEVIFIHPQKIGYNLFFRILKNNNLVKVFIVDNSFFCIESYNYDKVNNKECLRCLTNENCLSVCKPATPLYSKSNNIKYLEQYKEYSSNIKFFVQNQHQVKLLKTHFGNKIQVEVIGLDTGEVTSKNIKFNTQNNNKIVYHGSLDGAKGIKYILSLARHYKDYPILIPYTEEDVLAHYPEFKQDINNCNLQFRALRWDSGLKEEVENALLVLTPSLWSAPIEGALLKSIAFNGNVAVYDTQYGFQKDIPENVLTRLDNDFEDSIKKIKSAISNVDLNKINAQNWIKSFITQNNLETLFSAHN